MFIIVVSLQFLHYSRISVSGFIVFILLHVPLLASIWQSKKTNCVNNSINILLHAPKPLPGRGDQIDLQVPLTTPF